MNSTIGLLLIIHYNSLNQDTNYYIASYILKNLDSIENISISSLAKNCYTSVNSINKFCHMLGFKSFNDFKINLISRIKIRKKQLSHRLSTTTDKDILHNITLFAHTSFDIDEFKKSIDELVIKIHDAKEIKIIGAYYPVALSLNFQEDMIIMNKFIYSYQNNNNPSAISIHNDELLLIISITGSIFDYAPHYANYLYKQTNIAIISGKNHTQEIKNNNCLVYIPIIDDNEDGNLLLVEVLRYIKYCYYYKYLNNSI